MTNPRYYTDTDGSIKEAILNADGKWESEDGFEIDPAYYDPGVPGVAPFETGINDPLVLSSKPHDDTFTEKERGVERISDEEANLRLARSAARQWVNAAVTLVWAPFVGVFGAVGGEVLLKYRRWRKG